MKVRIGRNGRLIVETDDAKLAERCKWADKGGGTYSAADSWINRMILGWPIEQNKGQCAWRGKEGLRDYQVEDIKRMVETKRILNGNDMGLGKTVEAIEACKLVKAKMILVVAPKSVLMHWKSQFKKWWPEKDVRINPVFPDADQVIIVNYEKLRSIELLETYSFVPWDVIIVDEAHRIKNRNAIVTKAIKKLHAPYRFALTGTPILNKPDDLYSILEWLNPDIVGDSYWQFVSLFCLTMDSDYGQMILGLTKDQEYRDLLTKLLDMVMIRHTKKEVLKELPQKAVYTVDLEIDKKVKKLYSDTKQLIFNNLPTHLTIANAAVHLLRLQQITSNPSQFVEKLPNPKFEFILDLLEDNPDKKFVVYSKFAGTVLALARTCAMQNIPVSHHIGDMTIKERAKQIGNFVEGKSRLFIATIASAGVGIDGLQYAADTAVFIDADWSPSLNDQAEDRLCRLGQTNPVTIYYLQYPTTIDKYVNRKVALKEDDIRAIVGL